MVSVLNCCIGVVMSRKKFKWKWTVILGIIGLIWGIVSLFGGLMKGTILFTTIEKIIYFPYWFYMDVLFKTPIGLISYVAPIAWMFIGLIGFLILLPIGLIIDNSKKIKRMF